MMACETGVRVKQSDHNTAYAALLLSPESLPYDSNPALNVYKLESDFALIPAVDDSQRISVILFHLHMIAL